MSMRDQLQDKRKLIALVAGLVLVGSSVAIAVQLMPAGMFTRTSGATDFIQFHIWLDPGMTVREAHAIVHELEEAVEASFPQAEVLIHVSRAPARPAPKSFRRPRFSEGLSDYERKLARVVGASLGVRLIDE